MRRTLPLLTLMAVVPAYAQQPNDYDYFADNRQMIRNGVQAVLMCNGLYTSNRPLERVFEQEVAYLRDPVGTVDGGNYVVEREYGSVAVGGGEDGTEIRAVFREGIGCVVMSPEQTLDDIDSLPEQTLPYPDYDPATTPWPNGDLIEEKPLPPRVDASALQAASDWAFDRETDEQDTLSLIVVHRGEIIHERYAEGIDVNTRTRTWSTAKSMLSTLIGMLVDEGRMALDEP
ncbi:MAG: serine hydrolase, partial [Pseudomonadota bacterium]